MLGVNVSARQFAAGTVADEVALVMHEYGIGTDELAIEESDIEIELVAREEARIAAQGITNADDIMTV
jgi:hypothetical protein